MPSAALTTGDGCQNESRREKVRENQMVSYEVGESFHVGAYLPCRTLGINVVFKIKKKKNTYKKPKSEHKPREQTIF